MEKHEGSEFRNHLKGKGLEMQTVADILEMSRQNLSYHLRKEELEDDFKRLVKDKMKIDFPLGKQADQQNGQDVERDIKIEVTNPFEFLITHIITIQAQNEVILEMLAEWASLQGGQSSSQVVSNINKRVRKKIQSWKDR